MAANFVLHRTLPLKCTEVNALSYPVHFNGSILKLNNIAPRSNEKDLDAQIFRICFNKGTLCLTFKKQKYIRMWVSQQKAPPPHVLIWRKTAILLRTDDDGLIFTKVLEMYSLTSNRYRPITATKSIKHDVKCNI